MRSVICFLVASAAMLDINGLEGGVKAGTMTMGECIPRAIIALIVAVIAVIIGDSASDNPREEANEYDDKRQVGSKGDEQGERATDVLQGNIGFSAVQQPVERDTAV